jgi:hypothetical protein
MGLYDDLSHNGLPHERKQKQRKIMLCALFHSVCHHHNQLSALLRHSDGIVSERDRAVIRSALSSDTATDYLLCFSSPSLIVNALTPHVLFTTVD